MGKVPPKPPREPDVEMRPEPSGNPLGFVLLAWVVFMLIVVVGNVAVMLIRQMH